MTDLLLENKALPHSIEAEQAVLASMFYDRDTIIEVMAILKPTDFYRPDHRILFSTIIDLNERQVPIDLITVTEQLQKDGNVEKAGGITYVAQVSNSLGKAVNAIYYANIVKEKATLRELIQIANNISNRSYEDSEDAENLLDDAERMVLEISQKRTRSGLTPISDIITDTLDHIEHLANLKDGLTGLTSGLIDLDKMTNGWQKSDFIILAARPAMGKTSLALNMAQNAAIMTNQPVAIFSLEMSKEQLVNRMVSSIAEIDQQTLRTGRLFGDDWTRLVHAIAPLANAPIYIDDTPGISIREIRAKARRLKSEHGLSLIVIDYLQLMGSNGRSESRQQEVSMISRSLKALARELNIPVIALSQLSRSVEQGPEKKPSLSHLRESGSLEQDADIVMFIYRDEYYHEDSEHKGEAELIIAKHRNGATGSVNVSFRKEFTKFGNLAHHQG
ncbi:MAG: replicative DNA helicase [Peptococcaceae bacterium]|nr:replicative DNA helicase [Peptococcaceae bacterium]